MEYCLLVQATKPEKVPQSIKEILVDGRIHVQQQCLTSQVATLCDDARLRSSDQLYNHPCKASHVRSCERSSMARMGMKEWSFRVTCGSRAR